MNRKLNLARNALETRQFVIFSFIIFRLTLELGYLTFVSRHYTYAGFDFDVNAFKYLESWILMLGLLFTFPVKIARPSDFMVVTLVSAVLVSLLTLYGLADKAREHLYVILLGYFTVLIFRRGRPVKFPLIRHGLQITLGISVFATAAVTAWMVASGGLQHFNLDLRRVYEFRDASAELTKRFGFQYFTVWATKALGPALLAIALWKRWWGLMVGVVALHIFWFGVSAHKSVLFYPAVIFALWLWIRRLPAVGIVPLGMAAVVFISLLFYYFLEQFLPASLFLRRVFFVIANNIFDYYEFFSVNQKVFWFNSILSSIGEYPYQSSVAKMIGEWRNTESHVNSSFLSTGFMHGGVLGVIFYGVLVGLLFRLIDSLAYGELPVWLAVAVLIVPMRAMLVSADFFTALLSHGVALALVLLFLMRSFNKRASQGRPSEGHSS